MIAADRFPLLEFPASLQWLNSPRLSLAGCRGRVVVLAFVNPASAWCRQRLIELEQWQARFGSRFQAIAVAVPRFDWEREADPVLKHLQRAGLSMPVALDADWELWRRYGIDAWPGLLLVGADGHVQALARGEAGLAELEGKALAQVAALPEPLQAGSPGEPVAGPRSPLRFPVGLAVNGERLFVADSGHHRILECTHEGRVRRQFGMGVADFLDGTDESAAFRHPHGLSLSREWLYVADTGNHAVRRINLETGCVDTLCGSGEPGETRAGEVARPRGVSLRQPCAVAASDRAVYLAQAGDNRIWEYTLSTRTLEVLAGSGRLELHDGQSYGAAFAQPVGLGLVNNTLYVCDALASALRSLRVDSGQVQTLAGQGLWQSGHVDGPREHALFQYPQAIGLGADTPFLYVADSGNGCLRILRLGGGGVETRALPRRLRGPAGLAVANGKVWIAETDAHAVLVYDPASGELRHVAVDE